MAPIPFSLRAKQHRAAAGIALLKLGANRLHLKLPKVLLAVSSPLLTLPYPTSFLE